jgi:hypothetical protein
MRYTWKITAKVGQRGNGFPVHKTFACEAATPEDAEKQLAEVVRALGATFRDITTEPVPGP